MKKEINELSLSAQKQIGESVPSFTESPFKTKKQEAAAYDKLFGAGAYAKAQTRKTAREEVKREAVKDVAAFALELKDAYSTPAYAGGWSACIKMLRRRGYGDQAIEAILRSKWTRWASDASNKRYGSVTSADLARFMDDRRNRIDRAAVVDLVKGYGAEYWVERGYAPRPDCGGDCDTLLAALKKELA